MKGFVPTPDWAVDLMIEKLFRDRPPTPRDRVLDPGSGRGAFVDGIIRYCASRGLALPQIVAIESDSAHAGFLRERFGAVDAVTVTEGDFFSTRPEPFSYVVGNPPYVSIGGLSEREKELYRRQFATAAGRFDLYILFFEKALSLLQEGGRLVFITPEKYLYVNSAGPLRRLLAQSWVAELHFFPEDTFPDRVTYPLVSTIEARPPGDRCSVIERDGTTRSVPARFAEASWLPLVRAASRPSGAPVLRDISRRISCGVATGADSVFVLQNDEIPSELLPFAHPTLSGRDVVGTQLPRYRYSMLVPYAPDGSLLSEDELGPLYDYLRTPERYARLVKRTCTRSKPWYAFHETPPLRDALRPKLLCKDIGSEPTFVVDADGTILPRHSLYYIVPGEPSILQELADFLNSRHVARWFRDHCQRAANGFLRVQSHVLKRLPLPPHLQSDSLLLGA